MQNQIFAPCPDRPNCVSSKADGNRHYVEPLCYEGDWLVAKQTLIEIIENIPRVTIDKNAEKYLHATFTSKIFGFIDDVEFLFDDTKPVIHVRSASRTGYYDFAVNRKRVEQLRKLLARDNK